MITSTRGSEKQMTRSARELFDAVQTELAPRDDENQLVPLIAEGKAPRSVFAAIAAEELRIVRSDWRSVLTLASRSEDKSARAFFAGLAQGEAAALEQLPALAAATGLDDAALEAYQPLAGCQGYPAYFAWMALNGEPADVIVALITNFAAWGRYCATIATAMREKYGFEDEACGFFDFFAAPFDETEAVAAIQSAIDAGKVTDAAWTYARHFQSFELMFWNTLAQAE
ncbi:MAG: transcriptional regulator [Amycolatopsis sp.]|jgi:hypothetical protein|nr:transcriptional regulator [Amycolatopsis sp.]